MNKQIKEIIKSYISTGKYKRIEELLSSSDEKEKFMKFLIESFGNAEISEVIKSLSIGIQELYKRVSKNLDINKHSYNVYQNNKKIHITNNKNKKINAVKHLRPPTKFTTQGFPIK